MQIVSRKSENYITISLLYRKYGSLSDWIAYHPMMSALYSERHFLLITFADSCQSSCLMQRPIFE